VFKDELLPPWENWSWGVTLNMASPATGGDRRSIHVQHNQAWSSLSFHAQDTFASSGMLFFSVTKGILNSGMPARASVFSCCVCFTNNNQHAFAGQLNSCYGQLNNFTHPRALLVLHGRGILWPWQLACRRAV
jgi:hypothetical protein